MADREEPVGGTRRSRWTLTVRVGAPCPWSPQRQSPPATSMPQPACWIQHAGAASTPSTLKRAHQKRSGPDLSVRAALVPSGVPSFSAGVSLACRRRGTSL